MFLEPLSQVLAYYQYTPHHIPPCYIVSINHCTYLNDGILVFGEPESVGNFGETFKEYVSLGQYYMIWVLWTCMSMCIYVW